MTDEPKESQEPGAPKEPQYKEVSETELKRVLAEHEKWLQTDGEEGAQANLCMANSYLLLRCEFLKTSIAADTLGFEVALAK